MKKDIDKFLSNLTEEEIQASFTEKMAKKAIENREIKEQLTALFNSDETYLLEHCIDTLYTIALKTRNSNDSILKYFSGFYFEGS